MFKHSSERASHVEYRDGRGVCSKRLPPVVTVACVAAAAVHVSALKIVLNSIHLPLHLPFSSRQTERIS